MQRNASSTGLAQREGCKRSERTCSVEDCASIASSCATRQCDCASARLAQTVTPDAAGQRASPRVTMSTGSLKSWCPLPKTGNPTDIAAAVSNVNMAKPFRRLGHYCPEWSGDPSHQGSYGAPPVLHFPRRTASGKGAVSGCGVLRARKIGEEKRAARSKLYGGGAEWRGAAPCKDRCDGRSVRRNGGQRCANCRNSTICGASSRSLPDRDAGTYLLRPIEMLGIFR